MSNCYFVDDNGQLTKLSKGDVVNIAIRQGANSANEEELTLEQVKEFIADKAMIGNSESENVCFSYSEACTIARERKARHAYFLKF